MKIRMRITSVPILVLSLLLVACGSPNPQPPGLTPIPTLARAATVTPVSGLQGSPGMGLASAGAGEADAALGAPLYLQHCSPCHGLQGQGVDAPPLRNSQFVQTAGSQALFDTVADGRSGTEMPAWLQSNGGPLTHLAITSVISYLHTLQGVVSLPPMAPPAEEPTATPLPPGAPTPEPAQPSEPGGPGPAASLAGDIGRGKPLFGLYCAICHGPEGVQGIPNPGSDDGSVPVLNPIDLTIVNPDLQIFGQNVDRFIQHGSIPEGSAPLLMMPPFGDRQMLTEQEIADLIAFVVSLNQGGASR
jgi:mono/diheme cytochrome c family protein